MSQSSQRSIELFPSGSYRNFHFSSKPQYILLPLSYFRVRGSSGELDAIALKGLPLLSSHFLSPPPFLPHSSPSSTTNRFLTAPPLAELTLRAVPLLPLLSIHLYMYSHTLARICIPSLPTFSLTILFAIQVALLSYLQSITIAILQDFLPEIKKKIL